MIKPTDILLRKVADGTTVWVSERAVAELCGMGTEFFWVIRGRYKQSLPPSWRERITGDCFLDDTGKSWRWGRKNGIYYYDIDRIPSRKPCNYRDKLPSKDDLIAMVDDERVRSAREREAYVRSTLRSCVASLIDNDDVRHYLSFALGDKSIYNKDKAIQLAEALAWCRLLKNSRPQDFGLKTSAALYGIAAEMLAVRSLEGLRITTGEALRKKVEGLPAGNDFQRAYLVSGKYGNDNRRIIDKFELVDKETGEIFKCSLHQAMIFNYWLNIGGTAKPTAKSCYDRYRSDMEALGEIYVSRSTYTKYVNTYVARLLTTKERHGGDYFRKHYMTYVPAKELVYGNSLWCADGSGIVNYQYRDAAGTLKSRKLFAIFISDVASKKIVGYAVAPSGSSGESKEMFAEAMKMALINNGTTEVLEMITDNGSAFTDKESKELLSIAVRRSRRISPGNSQGNPAEMLFRLFKANLKSLENLIETSFASTSINSQANPDYWVTANLPSYEQAKTQLAGLIDKWNNTPLADGSTPAERFENKNPEAKAYDPRIYRMLTGEYSKVDISYMRGFVNVRKSIDGYRCNQYQFEIPQTPEVLGIIAKQMGYSSKVDVGVYWDADTADIYTVGGKFMFTCGKPELASPAYYESTPEERNAMRDRWAAKRDQTDSADSFIRGISDAADYVRGNKWGLAMANNSFDGDAKEGWNDMQVTLEDIAMSRDSEKTERRRQRADEAAKVAADALLERQRYERNMRVINEYKSNPK